MAKVVSAFLIKWWRRLAQKRVCGFRSPDRVYVHSEDLRAYPMAAQDRREGREREREKASAQVGMGRGGTVDAVDGGLRKTALWRFEIRDSISRFKTRDCFPWNDSGSDRCRKRGEAGQDLRRSSDGQSACSVGRLSNTVPSSQSGPCPLGPTSSNEKGLHYCPIRKTLCDSALSRAKKVPISSIDHFVRECPKEEGKKESRRQTEDQHSLCEMTVNEGGERC